MKHLLLFALLLTIAYQPTLLAQSASPTPASDPLVGRWRWNVTNNAPTVVEVCADGTTRSAKGQTGEWMLRRLTTPERRYIFVWGDGRYVDSIVLSTDGKTISGHNASDSIKAERIALPSSDPSYFGTR